MQEWLRAVAGGPGGRAAEYDSLRILQPWAPNSLRKGLERKKSLATQELPC